MTNEHRSRWSGFFEEAGRIARLAPKYRRLWSEIAIVLLCLGQVLDGILTYHGLVRYGPQLEGNPIVAWLIFSLGPAVGLLSAKTVATTFCVALYIVDVHRAIAWLALFYWVAAVIPWMALLFYL